MSEDIKMGDVFNLPIGPGGTYTRPTDLAHGLMHSAAFDQAQIKAAIRAINTHDSLVEQSAKLVEVLESVLPTVTSVAYNNPQCSFSQMRVTDVKDALALAKGNKA